MNRKKFSKTGIALVGSMLICLLICLAVLIPSGIGDNAADDLNDDSTPDMKTVLSDGSPLLIYDKRPEAQSLITAYEQGSLEKVLVRGTDGTAFEADTPEETKELYRLVKNLVVGEETADTKDAGDVTEITFLLADGTECGYRLLGDSKLQIGDAAEAGQADGEAVTVTVTGAQPLIEYIQKQAQ